MCNRPQKTTFKYFDPAGLSLEHVAQGFSAGNDGLSHFSALDTRPLLGGPQCPTASFGLWRRGQVIAAHGGQQLNDRLEQEILGHGFKGTATGNSTRNVAPRPGSLSHHTRPFIASTIFFTIDNPKPVECSPPVGWALNRANLPNSFF